MLWKLNPAFCLLYSSSITLDSILCFDLFLVAFDMNMVFSFLSTKCSMTYGWHNSTFPIIQIYDFDRDYKDVGVAQFKTKYFVVRNCLPYAKSDMLLSAWNPPPEWGKYALFPPCCIYGLKKLLLLSDQPFHLWSPLFVLFYIYFSFMWP